MDKKFSERIDKLSRFGEIFEGYNDENSSLFYKKFLFFRQKINLYCYFANEIIKNKDRFKDNFVVFRTLGVNAPHLIKLFNILKYLRLLKILYYFGDIFLKIFKVNHLEKNKIFDKIDMVLISFKIYDPSGFCDEVIRHCKRNKIISYGVQINWDALVFRIPYQIPDYLGVWGEQSFVFALGVHKISPYRIFPIGPLLFDKYKNLNISKIQAQKMLGLPENKKIIAVCLSDNAFDNIF